MNRATSASVGGPAAGPALGRVGWSWVWSDALEQGGREAAALHWHHSGIAGTVSLLCACRAAFLLYGRILGALLAARGSGLHTGAHVCMPAMPPILGSPRGCLWAGFVVGTH